MSSEAGTEGADGMTELGVVEAIELLIKSVINIGQKIALMELAVTDLQERLALFTDDGK
jgi:hypothetical protein